MRKFLSLATVAALPLGGCMGVDRPTLSITRPAPSGDEVAHVGLVATSVMPWQDIAADLQVVQFTLEQDALVREAVQTTSSYSSSYRDQMIAKLALTFAGPQIASETKSELAADGTVTETGSRTVTRTSPGAPDVPSITIPLTDLGKFEAGADAGVSAQMKYEAAAALAERLAILNKRASSIPMRPNMRAYFVSLQLSIMPKAHGYPYDTTIDLSLDKDVVAIPMLVADAIEGTRENSAIAIARQLGLGLKATSGFFGGGASLEKTLESIEESEALRANSLYTVGRIDDHSVRIRIGANRYGRVYEMIPKAHNISLVLLVPRNRLDSTSESMFTASATFHYEDAMAAVHVDAEPPYGPLDRTSAINARIFLPRLSPFACPPSQTAMLREVTDPDGKNPEAVVSLSGGEGMSQRALLGTLTTPKIDSSIGPANLALRNWKVNGSNLVMSFPSHMDALPEKPRVMSGTLVVTAKKTLDGDEERTCSGYPVMYVRPQPAPKPVVAKPAVAAKPKGDAAPAKPDTPAADAPATPVRDNPLKLQSVPVPVTVPS